MRRLAPAKVNLFLHVGAPASDGYHPVGSLMVFADIGDEVALLSGVGPDLAISGPFAEGLAKAPDNLILRARDALTAGRPSTGSPFHLTLDKRLPIAAGLGGGSADAAAALILLRGALAPDLDDDALQDLAASLGSDVPACLFHRPVIVTGRGDRLSPAPAFPTLSAVLANPRLPSPTGAVYKAYDKAVAPQGAALPVWPSSVQSPEDMATFLAACRNDLEAPAVGLQPRIADVLDALTAAPQTLLARMSGSGATCFALCRTDEDAGELAESLSRAHRGWWVTPCRLGGGAGQGG